jgi:fido (protein-threonine AMPylation protein)
MDQFGKLFEVQLIRGKYKHRPNNPKKPDGSMHQYCPPEQVDPEMERLLALHAKHEQKDVPVEIEAAWLHHRFTQIHPYQDGNGRLARALTSLIFIKAGWFPLVVTREDRGRYIDALEAADEGGLGPLVAFLIDVQKRTLFQAVQAAADSQPGETVEDVIAAAKRIITGAGKGLDPSVWSTVKSTADGLLAIADKRIYEVMQSLRREIGDTTQEYRFDYMQVSPPAELVVLPYQANPSIYDQERTLRVMGMRMNESQAAYLTIQAQAVGTKPRGIIAIVALFRRPGSYKIVSKDVFQVNYAESYESAERRFRPWLEESLVNALTLWRKSL